jgi:hypothetical protein
MVLDRMYTFTDAPHKESMRAPRGAFMAALRYSLLPPPPPEERPAKTPKARSPKPAPAPAEVAQTSLAKASALALKKWTTAGLAEYEQRARREDRAKLEERLKNLSKRIVEVTECGNTEHAASPQEHYDAIRARLADFDEV